MWVQLKLPFFDGMQVHPAGLAEFPEGTVLPTGTVLLADKPAEPTPPPTLDTLFAIGEVSAKTTVAEPTEPTTLSELGKKK